MKRLNRKGFTLVELLAVIVILAIVVGITLVTVLPTLKKSRQEAFQLTSQTAADYLEKQYQLYVVGEVDTIPSDLQTAFAGLTFNGTDSNNETVSTTKVFDKKLITSAGLKPANYVYGSWYVIQSSGRVCVTLAASTNTTANEDNKIQNLAGTVAAGEYYDATEASSESAFKVYVDNATETSEVRLNYSTVQSSGCSTVTYE